jgi:hypothetical protein
MAATRPVQAEPAEASVQAVLDCPGLAGVVVEAAFGDAGARGAASVQK